jgi:hypothetical protein
MVTALNAYSAAQGRLALLAVYIAADMLRDMLRQDRQEAAADALMRGGRGADR